MSPQKRNRINAGLPAGWRWKHGAYWYRVPPAMRATWNNQHEYRLGRTLPEAYAEWSRRLVVGTEIRTIGKLLDRYAAEVIPAKAPATRRSNLAALGPLRAVFGHMALADLKPAHVYQYVDKRGAPVAARREIEVLRHAYTMAVAWGVLDRNPLLGQVRLKRAPARSRYVTDAELTAALTVAPKMLRAYLAVKLLSGLRRGDLLRLRMTQIQDDGIHVQPAKTAHSSGLRRIIEWSPALRDAVEQAKAARSVEISPLLFCARKGRPYINDDGQASAFKSLWQRFMAKVVAAGIEVFTEHDLRAKCASDATTLEHAAALLAHASSDTTKRVYRRRPERVRPLR